MSNLTWWRKYQSQRTEPPKSGQEQLLQQFDLNYHLQANTNRLYKMIFYLAFKNKFCLKGSTTLSNNGYEHITYFETFVNTRWFDTNLSAHEQLMVFHKHPLIITFYGETEAHLFLDWKKTQKLRFPSLWFAFYLFMKIKALPIALCKAMPEKNRWSIQLHAIPCLCVSIWCSGRGIFCPFFLWVCFTNCSMCLLATVTSLCLTTVASISKQL